MNSVSGQTISEYRIISSNLGTAGSSTTVATANGTYLVSQSVGQASVIGTHSSSNGYIVRQGYQQPLENLNSTVNTTVNLNAKVHPNPFTRDINISFSSIIKNNVNIQLFDVLGKLIYSDKHTASQTINLQLGHIQKGTYFLKVTSKNKSFNTKLIKI
ncbi:hypothetical protein BTO05_04955 [Winogradskyella sp. PC-19]|nr:hypothetical protein BTO05_04955 [Winogradskyella sp. PC-19]